MSINFTALNEIFHKYATQEVRVKNVEICGFISREIMVAPADKTIKHLREELKAMGLQLRVLFPGEQMERKAVANRVNVYVDNYTRDGRYRIGATYKIG